ncbi:2108_t:CDS:2 [Funneliformis caledonium]|uniref:2108_t:CDS:1 n=1 Tax=Funneliformis caledonium TaxID=1117310 RepID=A0A9N9HKJ0_9GLOM|nr:2108_t:CDS:2 [Funneliformis caledonium]
MITIDIYDEVNRLSDINDVEKLTEKEVADLFTYFNNIDKLPGVEKALIKSKNDKVKLTYLRNLLTSEFPNKRMKVDDGDLLNFWKALRTTTIGEKDNSLKLPDNIHFFGRTDEASVLFIRQYYRDLFKVVFSNNTRRLIITRNPGIGKTFFGYYILYELMRKNATVIYDKVNKFPILFSNRTAVVGETLFSFYDLLNKQDVWYIVDGKEPHDVDAKTILVCSPKKNYYVEFDKHPLTKTRYMSTWDKREIDTCWEKIYKNKVDKKIVDDLFYK